MEENKNQTGQAGPNGIVVKDYDGNFKVLSDGELKDLDALLSSTESSGSSAQPMSMAAQQDGGVLSFPKFTDLAVIPKDEHFQAPETKQTGNKVAELQFHPDDTAEVERELEKLNAAFNLNTQKQYSVAKITQKLIDKHGLKLSQEDVSALHKVLLSYFRQARSLVETRAMLTQSKQAGGLGIALDTADHMIAVLKHLKLKIEESDGIVVEVDEPSAGAAPASPKMVEEKKIQPQQRPMPAPEPPKPALPNLATFTPPPMAAKVEPAPVRPMTPPPAPAPEPPRPEQPKTPEQPRPVVAEETPKINRPQIPSFKPPMMEIKRPQTNAVLSGKPTGRVDELALMDMATWRMLDPDPRIRAGKILGKIQNLEQESLTRKSQGIQAWRSNEVYQYYLMIGQMSLEQKKDVAEVIQALTAQGQQTLTLDEFEAISDLNRMLRY